jgi:LacI family transcriptional regulator
LIIPEHEDAHYFSFLRKTNTPFVLLNRIPRGIKCDYVATHQSEGSRIALSYLIGKGVRNIMYLVRTPMTSTVTTRISACQKTAREHGLSENAIQVVECGDSLSSAYEMTFKVLGQYQNIKGIYAWDDVMAMGAIRAVFQLGLKIPDDISIIGYDDIEMAKYFNPAITTIRQNIATIGQTAAEILIQKINSGILYANKCIILEPELVVRETA